jgi:hypothetical protein
VTVEFLLVLIAFILAVVAACGVAAGRFSLFAASFAFALAGWLSSIWPG